MTDKKTSIQKLTLKKTVRKILLFALITAPAPQIAPMAALTVLLPFVNVVTPNLTMVGFEITFLKKTEISDFLVCEAYYQLIYNLCIVECDKEDFTCFQQCSRVYAENLLTCPCQENSKKYFSYMYMTDCFLIFVRNYVQMAVPAPNTIVPQLRPVL